jgi:hypothetical protein
VGAGEEVVGVHRPTDEPPLCGLEHVSIETLQIRESTRRFAGAGEPPS